MQDLTSIINSQLEAELNKRDNTDVIEQVIIENLKASVAVPEHRLFLRASIGLDCPTIAPPPVDGESKVL